MESKWLLKAKSSSELPQRLRPAALTANDRQYLLDLAHILVMTGFKRRRHGFESDSLEDVVECNNFMNSLLLSFCSSMIVEVKLSKLQHYNRTISDFSDNWILSNTRFRCQADCRRAFNLLQLPVDGFILPNRSRVSSEEAWLVTLYRCTYPGRLIDIAEFFGRDITYWSRVIKCTLSFILINWYYLIGNNMEYWAPYFQLFNAKINLKIKNLGFQYDERLIGLDQDGRHLLSFIIDCVIIPICNFMAGALERGINA